MLPPPCFTVWIIFTGWWGFDSHEYLCNYRFFLLENIVRTILFVCVWGEKHMQGTVRFICLLMPVHVERHWAAACCPRSHKKPAHTVFCFLGTAPILWRSCRNSTKGAAPWVNLSTRQMFFLSQTPSVFSLNILQRKDFVSVSYFPTQAFHFALWCVYPLLPEGSSVMFPSLRESSQPSWQPSAVCQLQFGFALSAFADYAQHWPSLF